MTVNDPKAGNSKRKYPHLYERIIPFALGLIALLVISLLIITIGVALGVWGGPA